MALAGVLEAAVAAALDARMQKSMCSWSFMADLNKSLGQSASAVLKIACKFLS